MVLERLKEEYSRRAESNPAYSLRAFARSLEVDSSTLSSLMSGKRPLSLKMADRLLEKLNISPLERKELLFAKTQRPQPSLKQLEEVTLQVVASWEHFAILSLIETKYFQSSPKYIARKLGLSLPETHRALQRLEQVGLIQVTDGVIRLCQNGVLSSQDIPSPALRSAHRQYLQKALESLNDHHIQERDITGTTMAIDPRNLSKAKKLIAEFRQSLAELLESGQRTDVYRLNIQLFPLEKGKQQ